MKNFSWVLMLVGLISVCIAIYYRSTPLVITGGLIFWVGEMIPRNLTHLVARPIARPGVRRTIDSAASKPQEKSA